jgi:hypothetical protein
MISKSKTLISANGAQFVRSAIVLSVRNSLLYCTDSWIKRKFSVSNDVPGTGKSTHENLTVLQLRERLRSSGLPVSGRKQDLIERLRSNDLEVSLPLPLKVNKPDGKRKEPNSNMPKTTASVKSPERKSSADRAKEARDFQVFLHSRLRSLYRRCLRSADECPTEEWARTLRQYIAIRFRSDNAGGSADKLAVSIANGEAELAQMEIYHKAREARDLQRRLENDTKTKPK